MEEPNPEKSEFFQSEMSIAAEDKFSDNDKALMVQEPEPVSLDLNIGIPEIPKEENQKPQEKEKKQELSTPEEPKVETVEKTEPALSSQPKKTEQEPRKEESKDILVQNSKDDKQAQIQIPVQKQPGQEESKKPEEDKVQTNQQPEKPLPAQTDEETKAIQEQSLKKNTGFIFTSIRIISHALVLTAAGYLLYTKVLRNIKSKS